MPDGSMDKGHVGREGGQKSRTTSVDAHLQCFSETFTCVYRFAKQMLSMGYEHVSYRDTVRSLTSLIGPTYARYSADKMATAVVQKPNTAEHRMAWAKICCAH